MHIPEVPCGESKLFQISDLRISKTAKVGKNPNPQMNAIMNKKEPKLRNLINSFEGFLVWIKGCLNLSSDRAFWHPSWYLVVLKTLPPLTLTLNDNDNNNNNNCLDDAVDVRFSKEYSRDMRILSKKKKRWSYQNGRWCMFRNSKGEAFRNGRFVFKYIWIQFLDFFKWGSWLKMIDYQLLLFIY